MRPPPKTLPLHVEPCELAHSSFNAKSAATVSGVPRIPRETRLASGHLSKTAGQIVLNRTGCAQLGGDPAKAAQLLSTRRQA